MSTLQSILFIAPVLLYSVIAHEYAHGYAALRQGDPTAYQLGRLTWNPIKHIDPFLTILLPLMLGFISQGRVILGGAKPVPVNPRNYRNYRRGDIIVSLAGVTTNLALALACTILMVPLGLVGRALPVAGEAAGALQVAMFFAVRINLILIAFNLIPIPPLDGSHVVKHLLPPAWAVRYQETARFGFLILIAILAFGRDFLLLWLRPALITGDRLIMSVEPYILPATRDWFR